MVTVLHGLGEPTEDVSMSNPVKKITLRKAYCANCQSGEHYLSRCSEVAKLSKEQLQV